MKKRILILCLLIPVIINARDFSKYEERQLRLHSSLKKIEVNCTGKQNILKTYSGLLNNPNELVALDYIANDLDFQYQPLFNFPENTQASGRVWASYSEAEIDSKLADPEQLADSAARKKGFMGVFTDYYVGGENASDSNPGTSSQPFATIQKAATVAVAGDVVNIRTGTYRETIKPSNSGISGNPIIFQPDEDAVVTVSGADTADGGWTKHSGYIYRKTIALPVTGYRDAITGNSTLLANQVFIDGKMMIEARWPNISDSDDLLNRADFRPVPKGGWISGATLTDAGIPDIPGGWTGGTIWYLGWYVPNTSTITSSSSGQIMFPSNATDNKHDYYYLTGRLGALDAEREWFYDGTTLYLWASDWSSPAKVEVKMRNYAFDLSDKSHITIRNISVFAATITTNSNSTNIILDRLKIQYVSHYVTLPQGQTIRSHANETGVRLMGANSAIINSSIAYSAGHGIVLGAERCAAENNLVHDISYGGTYNCGIWPAPGNAHQTIMHNTIYRTGRCGIDGVYSNKEIGYNDIYFFGLINTDLGAIYSANQTDLTGTRIHHNWLHDAKNDNNHAYPVGAGIYLDQHSKPAQIDHNVFWNNHKNDIRIEQQPAPYNMIFNNTMASNPPDFWYSFHTYPDSYPGNSKNNIYCSSINPGTPGSNEITSETNPLFVNPSGGGLGFRLQPGSPAIDHGQEIDGVTDGFQGKDPDIGAYEYGGTEWIAGCGDTILPVRNYYFIQVEFVDSISQKPLEGLEVILNKVNYLTNNQGIISATDLMEGYYHLVLPDDRFLVTGTGIITVHSDSLIRVYVRKLPGYSIQIEFVDSISGKPIEGLDVFLNEVNYLTNNNGIISISELKEGSHQLGLPDSRFVITGNGIIDVHSDSLIQVSVKKIPYLTLKVINRTTGSSIYRSQVKVDSILYSSNSSGFVNIGEFSLGPFSVSASHNDYFTLLDTLLFTRDTTIILSMTPKRANVTFLVSDINGPLSGAGVKMTGSQTTNSSGNAFFFLQPARENYTFSVEKAGYSLLQDTFYLEIDTTLEVMLEKTVSVHDMDSQDIRISPNPFDSYINVSILENSRLYLYDVSGLLRYSTKLEQGMNTIPTDNLENGGYFMKIITGKRVHNILIIK